MYFKQYSLDGLACQSYFIGDADSAVVVDPQRDVDIYLDTAQAQGMTITHVIDTHLHADHVSGNTELAQRTGAQLHMHRAAAATYPHTPLDDGDEVKVGAVKLRALFTPGHTPDHVCLMVADTNRADEPWFILTGDSLFVGDVGRPDLLGKEVSEHLAAQLYDSLHDRLLKLPDGLEVYPGHGAGSLCGRAMSAKLSTTIGFERRFNYALGIDDKQQFIHIISSDQPTQPPNLLHIKQLNREGPPVLGEREAEPLSAAKVRQLLKDGTVLVDTREPSTFGAGHVPGTLNVVASSNHFATRLGFLVEPKAQIAFVARHAEDCLDAMRAASRVGLDRVAGFVTAAEAKKLTQEKLPQWHVAHVSGELQKGGVRVLDVREQSEYAMGHAPGAQLIPLGQLPARLTELPTEQPIAVMCASGVRSSSAASWLARAGVKEVINVPGGFEAWEKAGLPIEH